MTTTSAPAAIASCASRAECVETPTRNPRGVACPDAREREVRWRAGERRRRRPRAPGRSGGGRRAGRPGPRRCRAARASASLLAIGSGLLAQRDGDRSARRAPRAPARNARRRSLRGPSRRGPSFALHRVLPGSLETLREEAQVCDAGREVDEAEARDEPPEEPRAEQSGHRRAAGPRAQERGRPLLPCSRRRRRHWPAMTRGGAPAGDSSPDAPAPARKCRARRAKKNRARRRGEKRRKPQRDRWFSDRPGGRWPPAGRRRGRGPRSRCGVRRRRRVRGRRRGLRRRLGLGPRSRRRLHRGGPAIGRALDGVRRVAARRRGGLARSVLVRARGPAVARLGAAPSRHRALDDAAGRRNLSARAPVVGGRLLVGFEPLSGLRRSRLGLRRPGAVAPGLGRRGFGARAGRLGGGPAGGLLDVGAAPPVVRGLRARVHAARLGVRAATQCRRGGRSAAAVAKHRAAGRGVRLDAPGAFDLRAAASALDDRGAAGREVLGAGAGQAAAFGHDGAAAQRLDRRAGQLAVVGENGLEPVGVAAGRALDDARGLAHVVAHRLADAGSGARARERSGARRPRSVRRAGRRRACPG